MNIETGSVALHDSVLQVSGMLTFTTTPLLLTQSRPWINETSGPLTVDLAEVERVDSAGLALLVEWLQLARLKGRTLTFANLPEKVHSLIQVNGLNYAFDLR